MRLSGLKILQIAIVFFLISCDSPTEVDYQGYIEGESLYLASPYGGVLEKKFVERGQFVKKGAPLFQLDKNPEQIEIMAQEAELEQAEDIYHDLLKPKRKPEIVLIEEKIAQALSQRELAKLRVSRYEKLYKKGAIDKDSLDAAQSRYEQFVHRISELRASLSLAKLGSRTDQINAQLARIAEIKERIKIAKWKFNQKLMYAPENGAVLDTFFEEGEWVPAQQAVLSLLPPKNMRVEFFVPASELPKLQLRQVVFFSCEGCDSEHKAMIHYISPVAEYVPPLIYSRQNTDKLVFRIKAVVIDGRLKFKVGQPVEVIRIEDE